MTKNVDYSYLDLLKELVQASNEPHKLRSDRTGTGTYGKFGHMIEHDMSLGFPLLTTKKVHYSAILSELIWFMKGESNIEFLLEHENFIWVGDALKKYNTFYPENKLSRTEFIKKVLTDEAFSSEWGQLGPVYGPQWRGYNSVSNPQLVDFLMHEGAENTYNAIDQLQGALDDLRNNKYSRRILVNAWNTEHLPYMTLPPCHILFQFYMEPMSKQEIKLNPGYEQKLSLMWYQRSVDTFLGLPFNIASYATLLEIISRMVPKTKAGMLKGSLGDTHLYANHLEPAKLQLSRKPMELPNLTFDESSINFKGSIDDFVNSVDLNYKQIQLNDYISHSVIKGDLSN